MHGDRYLLLPCQLSTQIAVMVLPATFQRNQQCEVKVAAAVKDCHTSFGTSTATFWAGQAHFLSLPLPFPVTLPIALFCAVFMCLSGMHARVCVCVCVRERERESACVRACVPAHANTHRHAQFFQLFCCCCCYCWCGLMVSQNLVYHSRKKKKKKWNHCEVLKYMMEACELAWLFQVFWPDSTLDTIDKHTCGIHSIQLLVGDCDHPCCSCHCCC